MTLSLAFYRGTGTLRDRLVRLVTRSRYSHVELAWSLLPLSAEPIEALCLSASSRDGGVRLKTIAFKPGHWDFLPLPAEVIEHHAWQQAACQLGRPYDMIGAIGTRIACLHQWGDGWFCSELVAYALGLQHPHRYAPGDLYRLLQRGLHPAP